MTKLILVKFYSQNRIMQSDKERDYRFSILGYIQNQINDLMVLCTPLFPHDSMLECSKNLRFCHGRNIMINLTDLATEKQAFRYKMDVLQNGQIGNFFQLKDENSI